MAIYTANPPYPNQYHSTRTHAGYNHNSLRRFALVSQSQQSKNDILKIDILRRAVVCSLSLDFVPVQYGRGLYELFWVCTNF